MVKKRCKSKKLIFIAIVLMFGMLSIPVFAGGQKEGKKAELTIMHYLIETGKLKALNDTVDGFKAENPNVQVTIQGMSLDQYTNTLNMKIASNDVPDIMFGNPKSFAEVVNSGNVLDITNEPFTKNILESVLKDVMLDGKVYGIPMDLMLSGVIYNKDIFAKYDIKIPKTWDEFVSVMDTLKKNGVTPVAAGYKDLASVGGSYWAQSFGGMLAQIPTMRADIMSGKMKPSDYPLLKVFLTHWQTINTYTDKSATSVGVDRSEQDFASGKAAMIIIGSWAVSSIRNYGPKGNFGAFLYPFFNDPEKNKMQYNTDDTWMISAKGQNVDIAKAFFTYATSPDAASTWATDVSAVPAIKGAKAANLDPIIEDMNATLQAGQGYNAMAETAFSGQFAITWDQLMQGWCFVKPDASADDYLKSMDKAMAGARSK
ncbi:MAG: extracellular solute-binding protein [Spirochaetes bacterium]|nr:extracellular solute-binding protein [Spirochaetota bacterium]